MDTMACSVGLKKRAPAGSRAPEPDARVSAPPGIFPPPDDLELLARVHQGEYFEVWQARERATGTLVAYKQVRPDGSHPGVARVHLANEALILERVAGPWFVSLLGTDLDAPWPGLRLEWIAGQSVRAHLCERNRLPLGESLWIARQCAQGLLQLLEAGFLHTRLTSDHVLLNDGGSVKLIDLAWAQRDTTSARELGHSADAETALAPEGVAIDPRSRQDLVALGGLLVEMLCGKTIPRLIDGSGDGDDSPAAVAHRLRVA
ncbi:MAG: hypothetical protein EHM42_12615, partial [Planctomycetaceae bacterium]